MADRIKRTVFILGAGASLPYTFPLGKDLIKIIKLILGPNPSSKHVYTNFSDLYPIIKNNKRLLDDIQLKFLKTLDDQPLGKTPESFLKHLDETSYPSIDDAITGHHEDYEDIGRLSIALTIKHFENNSVRLKLNYKVEDTIEDHWYKYLLESFIWPNHIEIGSTPPGLLTFLTFNYDRTLEYYLLKILKNRIPSDHHLPQSGFLLKNMRGLIKFI